jgi:hypothetical protein
MRPPTNSESRLHQNLKTADFSTAFPAVVRRLYQTESFADETLREFSKESIRLASNFGPQEACAPDVQHSRHLVEIEQFR